MPVKRKCIVVHVCDVYAFIERFFIEVYDVVDVCATEALIARYGIEGELEHLVLVFACCWIVRH